MIRGFVVKGPCSVSTFRALFFADKIVVLADGKVAEEGSPAELMAKDQSIFRRMTQLQAASADWSI